MADIEATLSECDSLHTADKPQEALDKLKELEASAGDNAEILWRMARECRTLANLHGNDEAKRKEFTYKAFEMAKRGLEVDGENWCCHKWMGIMLDLTGRLEGTKKRIENSFLVKEHFTKAVERKPDDAIVLHCLGVWCFEVADLGWMQKKLAATFFATPPSSTYEEALEYLLRAEKSNPNFYCSNLLYLGKANLRLKNKSEAKQYFQQTIDYNGNSYDDQQAKKEASDLIKKC